MIVKGAVTIKHSRSILFMRSSFSEAQFCAPLNRYCIKNKCSPKAAVLLKFINMGSVPRFISQLPAGGINVFATAAAQAGIYFIGIE